MTTFRGYCEGTKKWIYFTLEDIFEDIDNYFQSLDNITLWTRLKDKNGVEIYEDDILRLRNGKVWLVNIPDIYELLWTGEINNVELISNKYQSPELLEK